MPQTFQHCSLQKSFIRHFKLIFVFSSPFWTNFVTLQHLELNLRLFSANLRFFAILGYFPFNFQFFPRKISPGGRPQNHTRGSRKRRADKAKALLTQLKEPRGGGGKAYLNIRNMWQQKTDIKLKLIWLEWARPTTEFNWGRTRATLFCFHNFSLLRFSFCFRFFIHLNGKVKEIIYITLHHLSLNIISLLNWVLFPSFYRLLFLQPKNYRKMEEKCARGRQLRGGCA